MYLIQYILLIFVLQFSNNEIKSPIGHNALSAIPAGLDCLCDLSGSFNMKEIQLTKGYVALVDDDDYEYINQWKWFAQDQHGRGHYAARNIYPNGKARLLLMHRIILNPPINMVVDHINHNTLDNRRCNIRVVSHRENQCNRKKQNEFIGVTKNFNKYLAKYRIKQKQIYLGSFDTPEEAHNAYLSAVNSIKTNV